MALSCPSCSTKYGVGGKDARPVILDCLCVLCEECALKEEAKAQQSQQQPAAASGGKKKGKGKGKGKKEEAVYTPTPCINCKQLCNTPVHKLLLDVGLMKRADDGGGAAGSAVQHLRRRASYQILS